MFADPQAKGLDVVQRSVLGSMLPEAMVCYLENYEAERFSEIFLGEFDTPEAIWSCEMRSADRSSLYTALRRWGLWLLCHFNLSL